MAPNPRISTGFWRRLSALAGIATISAGHGPDFGVGLKLGAIRMDLPKSSCEEGHPCVELSALTLALVCLKPADSFTYV